jgi:glycosyltransferase involved in cell wall biosynthesis
VGAAVLNECPLVSVVTPSYNQGRYIEETIQSVLSQDYSNLEYLVLDGGSSDATLEILQRYEGRLRWISESDRGQADAINKGFRLARGEILGWLNSDDVYLPGTIQKVVQYFQTHRDIGMLYGEGYHVDAMGKVIERYYTEPFDFRRLGEICFICQPTVFLRADVFEAIGPLEIDLRFCMDYDYWMRIAKRFRIGYLDEYLAHSRLHVETKTLSQRVEFHEEILQTVKKHYGRVPVRWIYAYAHVWLTEQFMPHLQGVHADGWASQRASVLLHNEWRRYQYLFLEGHASRHVRPMALRIVMGDRVLHDAIIDGAAFCIKEPLWRNDAAADTSGIVEVEIYADRSFAPQAFGINDDTRTLAYHVKELSLLDEHGGELVLYSGGKVWLFQLLLPLLVFWKSLTINHDIPCQELWRDLRRLTSALKRLLVGS